MFIPVIIFLASATFGAPTALSQSESYALASNPETLGAYVREYFSDTPLLADIAWCESRMRHLDKNGQVLRGTVDGDDVGVMQINTRYHGEKAEELGLNLYSLQGNLEYAEYLYEKQGSKPWLASSPCWGKLAAK
ncbi:MAG: hypothetical protein AAB439_03375 [Patescibacteria group bacterium]